MCAGTQSLNSRLAYKIPFALQWLWPAVILLGLPFAPESPWWLVRQGKLAQANKALRKLISAKADVEPTLAMVVKTNRIEVEMEAGSTYRDIFNKINRRRTEIATGVYTVQVFSGIYLIGYGTYFFEQAGLPSDKAFDMAVGFLAVGLFGTCLSWVLLIYLGRRIIYNVGLCILIALLLIIGLLDCVPHLIDYPGVIWTQSSLLIIWNFFYNLTIGPVGFTILCEISATRVRGKTIAFATAVQAFVGIGMTIAVPYMINPDQANLRGKMGFFFGGLTLVCLFWAYFRIPETKGRTYEELDIMFERNIPTKEFRTYRLET